MHHIKKKLMLRSETVAILSGSQLRGAVGGQPISGPVSECCQSPYAGCTSYDYDSKCYTTATNNCQTVATNCGPCP